MLVSNGLRKNETKSIQILANSSFVFGVIFFGLNWFGQVASAFLTARQINYVTTMLGSKRPDVRINIISSRAPAVRRFSYRRFQAWEREKCSSASWSPLTENQTRFQSIENFKLENGPFFKEAGHICIQNAPNISANRFNTPQVLKNTSATNNTAYL